MKTVYVRFDKSNDDIRDDDWAVLTKALSTLPKDWRVLVETGNVVLNPSSPGYVPGTLEAMGLSQGEKP